MKYYIKLSVWSRHLFSLALVLKKKCERDNIPPSEMHPTFLCYEKIYKPHIKLSCHSWTRRKNKTSCGCSGAMAGSGHKATSKQTQTHAHLFIQPATLFMYPAIYPRAPCTHRDATCSACTRRRLRECQAARCCSAAAARR